MIIKIIGSLKKRLGSLVNALIIGTHNGVFHVDEVVACAILCIIYREKSILILRSRDVEHLKNCDICVDVGGGKFDHHMEGFNETRKNGIKYASAGLVWREYGKQLISLLIKKYFNGADCDIDSIFETFDSSCIAFVDSEDNGIVNTGHCFSFVSAFLPLWFNTNTYDFNEQFNKALLTAIDVLEEELKTAIGKHLAEKNLTMRWRDDNYFQNGILEIPSQTIPWTEAVVTINQTTSRNYVNFVIFPYPSGGWAAQCVPPSLKKKFRQRIPFPKAWAGQAEKLPEISGVEGATFCHNGCFFVKATNKEAVIKMCKIAIRNNPVKYFVITVVSLLGLITKKLLSKCA